MKVSFCTGWDVERDGISDYSKHLVNELKKNNNMDIQIVKLVNNIGQKDFYRELADKANQAEVCHVQFNYVYFNGELPYRNRLLYFEKYLKIPLVITAHEVRLRHSLITEAGYSRIKRIVFNKTLFLWNSWSRIYHKSIYNKADKIIAHTKAQAELIRPLLNNPDRLMVLPHGIPMISPELRNIPASRVKSGLGLEGKIILTIFGFINKKKGYELVMDILSELPDNVILLIAGGAMTENTVDKEYYNSLAKEISARGLDNKIRITGYLKEDDVADIMAATDICLAPFLSGSGSGALSLCLGYHKAIIASDIPVIQEINNQIPCLELFRYPDAQDLLKKIKGLINNPGRINELSISARQYCQRFSYAVIATETIKIYEYALADYRRHIN